MQVNFLNKVSRPTSNKKHFGRNILYQIFKNTCIKISGMVLSNKFHLEIVCVIFSKVRFLKWKFIVEFFGRVLLNINQIVILIRCKLNLFLVFVCHTNWFCFSLTFWCKFFKVQKQIFINIKTRIETKVTKV